jgi:hypothetical protein
MGDHDTPSSSLRHVRSFNALSDGTDLVNLEEESVAHLLVDSSLNTGGVGDKEIISDNLAGLSHTFGHSGVGREIILVERIFNRDNRVIGCQISVEVEEFS